MGDHMEKLVCVVGPTASGKTALAVALAKAYGGEIISADSMQLYRGMDIGTAKPDEEERAGIPHHMLDVIDPSEEYSAARYAEEARVCVDGIRARGHLPIVAGGTGLYINALLGRVWFEREDGDPAYRDELRAYAGTHGNDALYQKLAALDPAYAETVHPNNVRRVIRGLEIIRVSGKPVSERLTYAREMPLAYEPVIIGLCPDNRETLYRRIDRRVDAMLAAGLWDEAARLRIRSLSDTAKQAIGYKELFAYFEGACTREEAVGQLKLNTRRYAKRQLTWFRADPQVQWIYYPEDVNFHLILQKSRDILKTYGIIEP